MSNSTKFTIALVIVIAWGFYSVTKAMTAGMGVREDACRTYHVYAHQKETDKTQEIDAEFCSQAADVKKIKESNEPAIVETPAVVIVDNDTPIIIDEETPVLPVDETPVVPTVETPVQPEVETPANGNPGNDKPVGQAGEKCESGGFCERPNEGNHGRSN